MFYAGLILLFIGYKIVGKKLDIYFFDLAIILANKSTQGNIRYGILSVFFSVFSRSRICSWSHVLQSVLHTVQVTASYLLMLAVMTFNVYLGLSVVIGAGIGYFCFCWKRAIIADANEHCH